MLCSVNLHCSDSTAVYLKNAKKEWKLGSSMSALKCRKISVMWLIRSNTYRKYVFKLDFQNWVRIYKKLLGCVKSLQLC